MRARKIYIYSYLLLISFFCISCTKTDNALQSKISYVYDQGFEISDIQDQNFKTLKSSRLGYKNGWYWFKVSVKQSSIPLIFNIEGNTIDTIEVYTNTIKIADNNNNIDPTNLALKVLPSNVNTYYIKAHFTKQVDFPLKIYSEVTYFFNKRVYYLINGGYYGFVIMVIIVNLFFYFSLKEKAFLAYCFFVAFTNIGLTDFDGLIHLLFEKDVIHYIGIGMHFLVPLSSGIFASMLLDHHTLIPRSKIIAIAIISIAICFYVFFDITDRFIYFAIGDTIGLLFFTAESSPP